MADERPHREVLEDALLRLLEPVVVAVEDLLRFLDVDLLLLGLVPGQREDPVDVVPHDGRLGGHRRHHLQLADLFLAAVLGVLRERVLGELLLQLLDLVLELVALAELLLDRAHLLVEVVLLLGLLHLLLDPSTDALLDLEDLDLGAHVAEHTLEPFGGIFDLQQSLLVFELHAQMRHDGIGQARRIVDRGDRHDHFGRNLLVQLHVVLEGGVDRPRQRLDLDRALFVSSTISTPARKSSPWPQSRARALPSTSTFTVPSGRRTSWTIEPGAELEIFARSSGAVALRARSRCGRRHRLSGLAPTSRPRTAARPCARRRRCRVAATAVPTRFTRRSLARRHP